VEFGLITQNAQHAGTFQEVHAHGSRSRELHDEIFHFEIFKKKSLIFSIFKDFLNNSQNV